MPSPRAHIAMFGAALSGALACGVPAAGAQIPVTPPVALPAALAAVPPGASLVSAPGALRGQVTRLRGTLPDLPDGATVQIQRLDPTAGWTDEATTTAGPGGAFVAHWRPRLLGRFVVRALAGGDQVRAAGAAPTTQLTVYRPVRATWYGPGLYGHTTACGEVLSRRLLGVAHRTLPCGTPVEVYLAGRVITVPVIDRGPFANDARYDLTSAAAEQLGLTETTPVGVAPQRGTTIPAPVAAPPAAP